MNQPNFVIEEDTPTTFLIRDVGPWDCRPTVTNAAEAVVAALALRLRGRRLEYYDSEGERGELLVANGRFVGFA